MSDAGKISIVLSVDKANFSAAMDEAQRQLDSFSGKAKSAGHGTVSSMQAASASIRLLENPLGNNIRAIERLISQSKVLSGVMQAAFPVVGAIAITAAVVKLGTEVSAFITKVNGMPAAITRGFDALNLSSRTANDQLDLTNARLENEIAKLEHKPENLLAVAIAETRVESDKLATSLAASANAVTQLLSANHIGVMGQLLGKGGTAGVEGSIQSFENDLTALGIKLSQAAQKPGNDAEVAALRKQITDKQNAGFSWAQGKLFVLDNPQYATQDDDILKGADNGANRASLLGFQAQLQASQHGQQSQDRNVADTRRKEQLDADKAAADARKAAAAAALRAQKEAAAAQLRQLESNHSDWAAEQDRSLTQDVVYWQRVIATTKLLGDNLRDVQKKINQDRIADNRQWAAQIAEATDTYMRAGKTDFLAQGDQDYIDQQGKATVTWIAAMRQSLDLQKSNSDAMAEYSLRMAVATGQMSKLDAAQVQANLHTGQFNDQLQALQDARATVANNASLSDTERKGQLLSVDNQIAALQGSRKIQVGEDQQATNPAASSGSVGFVDALNDFVLATRDAAGQMREITTSTLNSINSEIVKSISGQRTSWGNTGAGIFRNIAGQGLQKAEGSVLGMLGFGGKPDGSASKPFYVRMADGVSGAAGQAGSWLNKLIGGGSSAAASSASSGAKNSIMSTLGSGIMTALPMLAGGGPLSANTMAIVGEKGPELFMPTSSGHVIPNDVASGLGGSGDTNHTWNIDARGATDPAQVRAQVMAGIMEATPHIVAAANGKALDDNKRRAPSARR